VDITISRTFSILLICIARTASRGGCIARGRSRRLRPQPAALPQSQQANPRSHYPWEHPVPGKGSKSLSFSATIEMSPPFPSRKSLICNCPMCNSLHSNADAIRQCCQHKRPSNPLSCARAPISGVRSAWWKHSRTRGYS
jgi:hypothetical protein